ncbi:MAG TPA: glycosyl hydrolase, partial [Miltoncostaeaceae bacterium]|nr:glycosyl hydrolase [Miltoncostaeaceae bacterium]
PQRFAPDVFDTVRRHGAIPIIDWSPWDRKDRGYHEQPDFQLRDVIEGKYDPYIREWAQAAARWGHPMFVRLCHEMNGDWYPWSERENGNAPGEFVRAWRHIVDIFRAEGARNVNFVWAPNEFESYAGIPVSQLYPGDAYVDWVGMSGYNWGTGQTGSRWRTFPRTFTRTYTTLRALAPSKPLMIAEVASSERGGSKADWLRDALAVQLPQRFPEVKAVVYWNKSDEGMDWPIETSVGARTAFAEAIASPYYLDNRFSSLSASPIPAP